MQRKKVGGHNEESSVVSGESKVNDSIYTDRILVGHLKVAYTISLTNEIVKVGELIWQIMEIFKLRNNKGCLDLTHICFWLPNYFLS